MLRQRSLRSLALAMSVGPVKNYNEMSTTQLPVRVQRVSEASTEYYQRNNNFCIRNQKWIFGGAFLIFIIAVILLCLGLTGNLSSKEATLTTNATTPVPRPGRSTSRLTTLRPSGSTPATTPRPPTAPPSYVEPPNRLDCIPHNAAATEAACRSKHPGCLFQVNNTVLIATHGNLPACYMDPVRFGYRVAKVPSTGQNTDTYHLTAIHEKTLYSDNFGIPRLTVERKSGNIVRLKFDDANSSRYEVPVDLKPIQYDEMFLYEVTLPEGETATIDDLVVQRRQSGTKIWDFGLGGLFLEQQFLQMTTKLPSQNCYGFGDNRHNTFKHRYDWKTWPMFSRDEAPTNINAQYNLYGVHPFYMCIESDGNAHGVLLLNSNAMEYKFQPAPALTLRSIGGVFDFYIFMGPTPENVIQQYTQLTGRTFIPPYWALGFQISRWGFENLTVVQNVVERNVAAGVPLDAVYGDIDYMRHRQDFTVDQELYGNLSGYVDELHQRDMKYVIILDPGIHVDATRYHPNDPVYRPHEDAELSDVYIKWPVDARPTNPQNVGENRAMLGKVWPDGRVAFPDFFKSSTKAWWTRWINNTYHELGIKFDALWIDMNEVSSWNTNKVIRPPCYTDLQGNHSCDSLQCPTGNKLDAPPYRPAAASIYGLAGRLSDKTICMVAEQDMDGVIYKQYDVHSLYGWSQAKVTYEAAQNVRGERSFVFSRSTYPTGQQYVGHWLGDNAATFADLRQSIIGLLEYSLFGYAYVGADICGFSGNTGQRLCSLWSAAGAFYPFSRNHNALNQIEQDPGKDPVVARFARLALTERYRLLPYLYTLFYRAHVFGDTVSRPLHHIYPADPTSLETADQFLWGNGLMISPIVDDVNMRSLYIPASDFYDYYDGSFIGSRQVTFTINSACFTESADCPGPVIPLHLRGGHIIPVMDAAVTTEASRKNPMRLLIVTDSQADKSVGELFWDDGKSIDTYESGNYYYATFDYDKTSKTLNWRAEITNVSSGLPTIHELRIYNKDRPSPDARFDVFLNDNSVPHTADVNMLTNVQYSSVVLQTPLEITASFKLQLRERVSP